jgi:hypothetical protein
MHPLFSDAISRQHREQLMREATLEHHLAQSSGEQHVSKHAKKPFKHALTPAHRLALAIALLCILMPMFGTMLDVSPALLIGGCLLCLVGLAFTLRRLLA